jgi:xylulokinase
MYLIGLDIGSSSIKASLINAESGICLKSVFHPKEELSMIAVKQGWAEQDPEVWWTNVKSAIHDILSTSQVNKEDIKAIGISYQMHGLVVVDKDYKLLRPSIIWCDSRAVEIGNDAFEKLGEAFCQSKLLNSPGNFTASKLRWVQQNEPDIYKKIYKIMLPGDYIALKLTGEAVTTIPGLSEGIFWDYEAKDISKELLDYYGFERDVIPDIVPTFGTQGQLTSSAASELGLSDKTLVTYRAGDQPNNAFSLNVLNPGEIAATAGTSGVIYGISADITSDRFNRVNTFAHVNYSADDPRCGVLLCINGTGILYSWLRKNFFSQHTYDDLNTLGSKAKIGSNGLTVMPFGNGAERMLKNLNPGASFLSLDFNKHTSADIIRAAQEGIVFSLNYGLQVMKELGIEPTTIKAGQANMFQSDIFSSAFSTLTGCDIELYETDGSVGAARAAGLGAGIYKNSQEVFNDFKPLHIIEPTEREKEQYTDAYENWKNKLEKYI